MRIELNGVSLDMGQEGGGRSVKHIATEDIRNVEAYDSPGAQGSSYSDLGRSAVRISLEGTVTGEEARALLEGFWSCLKKGDPVEFNADLSGAADVTKVLIASFVVTGAAGNSRRYDYAMELWEYKEPPEEPDVPGSASSEAAEETEGMQEEKAKKWARDVADEAEAGINQITGVVLDVDGNPAAGVTVVITGGQGEIEVKTDDEGVYVAEDVKPGDYIIRVKDEGYEDIEEEVTVG